MKPFLIFIFSIAAFPCDAFADDKSKDAEITFVRRIAPLLQEKCAACHGADPRKIEGEFDVSSFETLARGGASGQNAIVTGSLESSPIYLAIQRTSEEWSAMPPKESERLSNEQVGWFREWILGGAPWPDEKRQTEIALENQDQWADEDGQTVSTSGGLSSDWTTRKYKPDGLWAYRQVVKPQVHAGINDETAAIDELVERRMPAGVNPTKAADARTFIRRASFDLIGLPPSPSEVESFAMDYALDADEAVTALVDRLLNSPHYGERMAQHWLDVVRYADSSGFANDYERGNAWRYRDYVIRSFNNDKPYDQFVREQIAGDEIDSNDPEKIIATGFLRMGPWELTGMEVAKIARQRYLDDVTNSVGETFLSNSLQCARCHDHKFDPVPTRDYYSIQAVFATTQLVERPAPFMAGENIEGFEERRFLEARKAEHDRTLSDVNSKVTVESARQWLQENSRDPAEFEKAVAKVASSKKISNNADVPLAPVRKLMRDRAVHPDLIPPPHVGFTPEDFGNERIARKGLERLGWEFDRYEANAIAVYSGSTPQMKSVITPIRMPNDPTGSGEIEETCILTGGDPFASGLKVEPGVLSVVRFAQKRPIPSDVSGRRLAFADWVASQDNPLTMRSIANRIWLWHFGEPIAGNPNNFGSTGKRPTHPELLDWLAATFVERGWSFKTMHRLIMNSQVYRRSANHSDWQSLTEKDPYATSYAVFKPRRLSAEELRDAMLAATGELNLAIGGIPCRPEINLEAAMQPRQVMGTFAAAWTPNPLPKQRHRRSIYALKLRGLSNPAMEVFNAPGPDFSCERRDVSSITPQVFALFNSASSYNRAIALASRVLKETKTDKEAIERTFMLMFGRDPNKSERDTCLTHWREMEAVQTAARLTSLPHPTKIRREAVEENTGEKFSFDETLFANEEFVSDLQPSEVDARTRALADVCLVLFNSNEFVYVY